MTPVRLDSEQLAEILRRARDAGIVDGEPEKLTVYQRTNYGPMTWWPVQSDRNPITEACFTSQFNATLYANCRIWLALLLGHIASLERKPVEDFWC